MKTLFVPTVLVLVLSLVTSNIWEATLRINGDNAWVGFVNGEEVADGNNWQQASITENVGVFAWVFLQVERY